jgi:hypothetical protein
MHLQNAFKIAPVSRKPSTELRQRLQVQKCARRDRLPARMPIQANLRWKFEKGNSVRWDVNPLRSREKPEVHQRANSDSQNDQDQSCKDSIGETWKSKRRGAVRTRWAGRINHAYTDGFSGRSASPARSSLRFGLFVPLWGFVRHVARLRCGPRNGCEALVQPERNFDRHDRRNRLTAWSNSRLKLPALHSFDRFLFQPEARALHH